MNTKPKIGEIIADILDGEDDRAIGKLFRLQQHLATEAIEAEVSAPPPPTENLPEIVPPNGKPKRATAREVDCPRCGAKAGTVCFELTGRGQYSKPTKKRKSGKAASAFHTARIWRAKGRA